MDNQVFFAAVRKLVFGGSLEQNQVDGINAILRSAARHNVKDPHYVANVLANVRRETGGYMLPIKETVYAHHKNKNPSDKTVMARLEAAWKAGKLSWVRTPYWRDGAFGRGQLQISHWTNYIKMGKRLGIPLRENPDLALDPDHGADIAMVGMLEGHFTGKALTDYSFPMALNRGLDKAKDKNGWMHHPRRIVNGNDGSDEEITRDHLAFYECLVAAGYGEDLVPTAPVPIPEPKPEPKVEEPAPIEPKTSGWASLIEAFLRLFSRA